MKFVALLIIGVLIFVWFKRNAENKANAEKNIQIAQEFLAQNRDAEGVVETDSGLQYQVLTKGENTTHPSANSRVKVHYHGSLLDGTVFDSSVERNEPISFGLNQVIKGWTEGVQLMSEGDKFKFYIPSSLGYGNSAAGKIAAGSLLIFEVELLAID